MQRGGPARKADNREVHLKAMKRCWVCAEVQALATSNQQGEQSGTISKKPAAFAAITVLLAGSLGAKALANLQGFLVPRPAHGFFMEASEAARSMTGTEARNFKTDPVLWKFREVAGKAPSLYLRTVVAVQHMLWISESFVWPCCCRSHVVL